MFLNFSDESDNYIFYKHCLLLTFNIVISVRINLHVGKFCEPVNAVLQTSHWYFLVSLSVNFQTTWWSESVILNTALIVFNVTKLRCMLANCTAFRKLHYMNQIWYFLPSFFVISCLRKVLKLISVLLFTSPQYFVTSLYVSLYLNRVPGEIKVL